MQSDIDKRRRERRKKIRQRRLKTVFILFLIIALIALAIMCFTTFFPIKRISVSGSKIYTKSEIIKASKLTTDNNLFAISEKSIENTLRKALPYVDDVKLKRVLPDAVILTVTDAKEYAFYKSDKKYYILSSNGYVLKQQSEIPKNVFEIVTNGISGNVGEPAVYENSAQAELTERLITALSGEGINIDKIDVTNSLEITLNVEERFIVNMGSDEYLSEKTAHLKGMIDSIPDRSGSINLSMWTPQSSQGTFVANKE